MIYLDNAATTFPKPECVYEALNNANRNLAFNAGRGESKESKEAFEIIDEARSLIAELAFTNKNNVVFTASATDALNIIIFGMNLKAGDVVYVSPFEHNATCRPLNLLKDRGVEIRILEFDKDSWEPNLEHIANDFALHKPSAVFISEISNVTGYIIPYREIFKLAKQYNASTILDCAQSFGLIRCKKEYADFIVFAGHKTLYASFGIGGFVNINNKELICTRAGGTGSDSLNLDMPNKLPYKLEYGSPNVVAAAGLVSSIKWLKEVDTFKHEKELSDFLINELESMGNIELYLPKNRENHVGVVSINIPGYSAEDVGTILNDEFDISVRTGYHCAPFISDFLESRQYNGTIRISVGYFNVMSDILTLIDALRTL